MGDKDDPVIVSYFDSSIRQSDLALLEDGCWLNDKLIGFMFEYFQHEVLGYKDWNRMIFVDPDVVQLAKLSEKSEVKKLVSSLNIRRDLVFLPINDNTVAEAGGSHWSLVAYDELVQRFEHYDSANPMNKQEATRVCNAFSEVLGVRHYRPIEIAVPQQTNGHDCGLHVIKLAEEMCRARLRDDDFDPSVVSPQVVQLERKRIRELIERKAKE